MSIGQRLKEERERLGYIQSTFAELVSTTKKIQIDYEKDITQLKTDYLADIAQIGVDINYIITGQKVNNDEFVKIPVCDVERFVNYNSICNNENILYYMAYRKEWLHNNGLFVKDLVMIVVTGDSMKPTIHNQDYILINKAETELKDGRIYVVCSDEILWVKRIQILPNNKILLLSDNRIYPAIKLDLEQDNFKVIGRVVNSSHNFY